MSKQTAPTGDVGLAPGTRRSRLYEWLGVAVFGVATPLMLAADRCLSTTPVNGTTSATASIKMKR